jgi:hypothetical protein
MLKFGYPEARDVVRLSLLSCLVRFSGEFAVHNTPKGLDFNPVIIGVVKDFHADSLHSGIGPSAFVLFDQTFLRYRRILVKIRPDDRPETIALIKKTWEKISPDRPFVYEFLDDALNRQYRREQKGIGFWIFVLSSGLIMIVSLLTLSGQALRAARTDPVKALRHE